MIRMEEAEKILREWPVSPKEEESALEDCLGRILAQDVLTREDMPPFDRSAMDGYVLTASDPAVRFKVVGTIAAGDKPKYRLHPGECARIMTGAMLPEGGARVVKREVTVEDGGFMRIVGEDPNLNVRFRGEDMPRGSVLLPRGGRIRPQQAALIASAGLSRVRVYKKPLVGIVTTGSELVEPGEPLGEGQIYNSNATSIASQVRKMGAEPKYFGTVADDTGAIRAAIESLIPLCDLVILSGGVSAGDYDFVPGVFRDLGVTLHFEKVAVQPGKPTVFGTKGEKIFFGLPGNPVSTFVVFEILIKPFIYRMMGHDFKPLVVRARLGEEYDRRSAERAAWVPVRLEVDEVFPLTYHGSGHLAALARADGLMAVPLGVQHLSSESFVDVRPI